MGNCFEFIHFYFCCCTIYKVNSKDDPLGGEIFLYYEEIHGRRDIETSTLPPQTPKTEWIQTCKFGMGYYNDDLLNKIVQYNRDRGLIFPKAVNSASNDSSPGLYSESSQCNTINTNSGESFSYQTVVSSSTTKTYKLLRSVSLDGSPEFEKSISSDSEFMLSESSDSDKMSILGNIHHCSANPLKKLWRKLKKHPCPKENFRRFSLPV